MTVLVTGGTGFVGSHVCRQLMAEGHAVRLLVRSEDKALGYYSQLGEGMPELRVGDITDVSSVERAMRGCSAVVHAAAGTPIRTRSAEEMFKVNVQGVRNVVDEALDLGLHRIICVSSITTIFNRNAAEVTGASRPTKSKLPYGRSKVEAEYYLRKLQREGAPITTLYPGGVIGPDDPGLSDTCQALKHRMENGFRIFGKGGMQHIDVRDLAAFACSLAVDGHSGRYLVPGVYRSWTELADIIEEVSGCQLERIQAQGWKLRLTGSLVDVVRKFRTVDSPISAETMRYATRWPEFRNTGELARRGIQLRDPLETFADTITWMVRAGHLDAGLCPKIAA